MCVPLADFRRGGSALSEEMNGCNRVTASGTLDGRGKERVGRMDAV